MFRKLSNRLVLLQASETHALISRKDVFFLLACNYSAFTLIKMFCPVLLLSKITARLKGLMQFKTATLTILFIFLNFQLHLLAQTFPCNGDFIISLYTKGEPPTRSHEINFNGNFVSFKELVSSGVVFNSVGFNNRDGFLYAVDRFTTDIIRLKSDGSFEAIGKEESIPIWTTGAGDVNKFGIYAVDERTNFTLYFYDVTNDFQKIAEVQRTWHPSTGLTGISEIPIDDFAFDPFDPTTIYTYQRAWPSGGFPNSPVSSQGHLLTINADYTSPEFGMTKVIAATDPNIIIHIGALFFDTSGDLYGYGSIVPGPVLQQKKLVRINKTTGETSFIGEGPKASGADGCSCPYTLFLEKTIAKENITCADEFIQFDFKLGNNAERYFDELIFSDTFPPGMEIVEIIPAQPLHVAPSPGTGIGTEILHYKNAKQEANSISTFSVIVKNPREEQRFCNQAYLQVPAEFGGSILSDDPTTNVFSDSSCINIIEFDLSDSEITINQPVNCISQSDGVLSIYSNQLTEDQIYAVSYLLDDVPQGPFLIKSDEGILNIQGLPPGLYTGLCVKGVDNASCSSQIPGTFGLFVPLGLEQIQAVAPSSYCIHDTSTIYLDATQIEGATYTWNGPNGFYAESSLIQLEEISLDYSGVFYVTAERDSCFSIDSVYVEIFPAVIVDLSITEQQDLCKPIQLSFQSDQSLQDYQWSPSELLSCDECPDPTILGYNPGQYKLTTLDENGCESDHYIDVESPLQKNHYIPSAFSPNGDGINDKFTLFGNCSIEEISLLQIYDRWGMLQYEAASIEVNEENDGWNGLSKDQKLNPGIYVYLFKIRYLDGSEEVLSGDVTLMK